MAYNYVYQKLYEAVNLLAAGSGAMDERLLHAINYLSILGSQNYEFPSIEIEKRLEAVLAKCSQEDATADEGRFAATIARMDVDKQEELAREILHIFCDVAHECGSGSSAKGIS